MSTRQRIPGERFHPTDGEMINFLKRFLKGETLPSVYPFQLADIYGDQPPWEIFGADSNSEEKVRYFFTRLKKHKSEHTRVRRTCANGTWKAQTGIRPVSNGKGTVVGFRRHFKFQCRSSKEGEHNKIWLMKEYYVGDDFFRENNILKEDIVVCRIKKNIREKSVKDDAVSMDEQELDQIIEDMFHELDEYNSTTQPATVCQGNDETHNEFIDNTMLHAEYAPDDYLTVENIEQGHGADHETNNNSEFWEAMSGILKGVNIDVPHDWLHNP